MEEVFDMVKGTPNDMELGKKIRKWYWSMKENMDEKWIYESPDKGKTITKRLFGAPLSEKITIKEELIEDWYKRDET